jgi:5-formyltetrahydrofolate cyclo-ligase
MTKNQLRSIYQSKRNAISETEKLKLDDLLLIQFQNFDFTEIQSLLTYWPMENHSEPNVDLMTRYLRLMIPEVRIAYPIINSFDISMKAIITDFDTNFKTNNLGITEPIGTFDISPNQIDLIFIPLLAFNQKGYRVGFGKGYYDRFLTKCKPGAIKMGFSYFEPVDHIMDTNQFDVPLNYCITPQHIYEF